MRTKEAEEKAGEEVKEETIKEKAEQKEEEIVEEAEGGKTETEKPPEEEAVKEIKEEEVKPPREVEEEIVEERFYTIPLGKAWLVPPNKRAPKAIRIIRDFVKKHMKLEDRKGGEEEGEAESKRLIISNEVNEKIWSRGIEKPPRKIRVRAARNRDGNVTVYLAEGD